MCQVKQYVIIEVKVLFHSFTTCNGNWNDCPLLLQVYDYGFSPQRGEGFKLAIHHHMDQPIMALSDVDISPGFVTQAFLCQWYDASYIFNVIEEILNFDRRFDGITWDKFRSIKISHFAFCCWGLCQECWQHFLSDIQSQWTGTHKKLPFSPLWLWLCENPGL